MRTGMTGKADRRGRIAKKLTVAVTLGIVVVAALLALIVGGGFSTADDVVWTADVVWTGAGR